MRIKVGETLEVIKCIQNPNLKPKSQNTKVVEFIKPSNFHIMRFKFCARFHSKLQIADLVQL
jgi:hypothetical protein